MIGDIVFDAVGEIVEETLDSAVWLPDGIGRWIGLFVAVLLVAGGLYAYLSWPAVGVAGLAVAGVGALLLAFDSGEALVGRLNP